MGLWSRFKRWVSRTFGGNDGSSRTTTRASRVSNYGGGGIRSYRDYSGGGYEHEYQSYQRRRELERQERKRKQDATTNALASISKRTDSLSSGRSPSVANNGTTRVLAKIGQKATPPDPKEKARQTSQQRATAQLKKISDNRKSYNKATNDRYNVDKNGLKARQAQKSQAYDVEAEKWETKQHPVATSFARGAASGVTFGGSELLAQKSKNRQKSGAEQFYQQNKNRKAEVAGEIAGSLVGFGLTGEASAKAVGKLTPKAVKSLGARGTEKLASSAMIRRAAEKEAVKRFGVEGATKEVINQIARRRATTAMAELGKDAAINMTTGLASDLSHSYLDASKDGTFDRGEFAKSMGQNAALNTLLGGATSFVPAFRVGKHFDDGIDALKSVKASNVADDVKVSLNRRRRTDVRMPEVRPQTADEAIRADKVYKYPDAETYIRELDERGEQWLGQHGHITDNGDGTYNLFVNGVGDRTLTREDAVDYITRARDALQEEEIARAERERVTRTTPLNEAENNRIAEIDNEVDRLRQEGLDDANQLKADKYKGIDDYDTRQAERAKAERKLSNEKETIIKKEPPRKLTKNEQKRQAFQEERDNLAREYEAIKNDASVPQAEKQAILDDMQELDLEIKDLDAKINRAAARAKKKASKATETYESIRAAERQQGLGTGGTAEIPNVNEEAVTRERPQVIERGVVDAAGPQTLDEAVERAAVNAVEQNADEVASAAKAVPNAEQAVKGTANEATEEAINRTVKTEAERREIRQTHEQLNADIQRVSDGKYGARKSYVTAADFAGDAEVDKLAEETRKVMDDLGKGDGLGDILKSDRVYTRNTREVRDKIAKEQAIKALNDPEETIKKLQAKLKNGEDFSLEDYGQMTAIKNFCNQNGIELPPDVAHDFSKVYMTSQTERAQLLRSSYLFMAENDPDFKQHLLRKDLQRFRETVCHITDKEWKEVSALLDKAKGENGWLDSEIKRLSALTGAENREAFEKGYRDLCKEVYRHTEPSFWEVVSLIRHSFMLSNLKTGANNIIGNLSQLSMYRLSDMLNVAFENQIAKSAAKNGEEFRRTTALLKNNELRKLARWGSLQSGKLGEAISKNADETEFEKLFNEEVKRRVADAMGDSKYGFDWEKGASLRHEGMGKVKGSVVKGAQKMSKAVGFMLNEPDSWFVEKSYRLAFAKYLEANGITTAEQFLKDDALIKEASDHAFDVALENTYKKANRLVNFLEGARSKGYAKHSKLYQKAIAIGLDAELPYLKVPVNLVINNFKYSPMGIVKSGANAMTALKHGDVDALNKACRELSKGLTGTGMAMVGFMLACEDQAGDDDWGFISSAKDELKEYGVRDNSLKIGNKNLSVANMGIGTVQFLMGARYAEEINDRGGAPSSFLDNFDILTSVFSANFDAVADMSLLDNAFAIFDAVSNKGEYEMKPSERFGNIGVAVAGNYAGQFVPSPVRAIARGTTSSDLDTNIKKGEGDKYTRQIRRSANNVISGIPGLNEAILPHKVDRHGNYVNERNTAGEKLAQSIRNVTDPFNTKTVKIPEADREEMKVTKKGKPYQPKGFDENRKYQAKIGAGKHAELIDLTGKEREQAARSYKNSGYDSATSVIKKGFFGDSHGARAAEILNNIPDDEEKAREYIFSTPEYQNLDNDAKSKFLDAWYGQGTGNTGKGRSRTANEEVYVNIKGGDEGDFRYQNDLHWRQQDKYENNQLADVGITKGQWADIVEAAQFESHKYKDGKNVDTINSAWKLKNALMGLDLTPEQRVAAYQAFRGKRNGFGWYDWDGASLKGYRKRRRRRGYRRYGRGGSSKKTEVPKPKTIKASSFTQGEALVSKRSSSSAKATPPKLKRVQAKIDLPNKKR